MGVSRYVSTKIGTIGDMTATSIHGGGKTHPGAVCPFGMVALGPDTFEGGDNGSGYSYHHTTIDGFSINHMSGVGWYGDLGNFQVMPTTGPLNLLSGTYRDALTKKDGRGYESDFSHDSEITQAGYYAVTLDTYGIRVEATSTVHTGMLRMTYPENEVRRVQINLARRIAGRSAAQKLRIIDAHTIEGCIHCPSTHGGFGHGDGNVNYDLYFYAELSEDWADFGVWEKNQPVSEKKTEYTGEELWFYAEYPPSDKPITIKTAISYINIEGARDNFEAEARNVTFDEMHRNAAAAWDEALSVIEIEDGRTDDEKLTVFYTTMYHALLDPRMYSDVNGCYLSADGSIRQTDSFKKRTVFSGWDVFRSEFPLLTIIRPDAVSDMINSLIDIAEYENVSFPRWELLGHETGCMLGDPGIAVVTDAYRKNIRSFDIQKAYEICLKTATDPRSKRTGFKDYSKLGYIPGNISGTLENAYADNCIALFAQELGDGKTAGEYFERGKNYRNIYDAAVGWMRNRNADGSWGEWRGEYDTRHCTESNIFQQSWFVPHDVQGLIALMGKARFIRELERLMSESELSAMWNEAYNHPNEPCHHIAHMFTDAGQPWRTQYWVRRIQDEAYNTTEYGFCGNEDVGQMSAWFALTALGFHMVAPGSNIFHINTPLFRKAVVRLDKNYHKRTVADTLTIETDREPSENVYIRSVSVNGRKLDRAYLTWDEISSGGKIFYELSDKPCTEWAVKLPPAYV